MENNLLTRKLTIQEQQDILNGLFGYNFENSSDPGQPEHWVLYDEEGREFYGFDVNCEFNLDTLAGIFSYSAWVYKEKGYSDCQYKMRELMGIK